MTYANGDVYVGEWKDGSRHGQGTYTWTDGRKYVGESKDNKWNGQGTMTWPDGQKYVGEWADAKQSGHGKFVFGTDNGVNAGDVYAGQFKNGLFHGNGLYTFNDGRVMHGVWKEDQQIE